MSRVNATDRNSSETAARLSYRRRMIRFGELWTGIIFACWITISSAGNSRPEVDTPQGVLYGKYMLSRNYRLFSAYLGIPYAEPPIGSLRLKAPVKVSLPSWYGKRDATADAPVCIQAKYSNGTIDIVGQEDCLYINVYSPDKARSDGNIYPVMVFIHGGAFLFGSGSSESYGPHYLLDKDVVLVTFNYRLGLLGFLTLEDDVLPGNYGMKDQVMALKWVKENIRYFGGDQNSVTIFGQSAGAVSVAFHLLAKSSKNLFERAISQSGTALNYWSLSRRGRNAEDARNFAKHVNCPYKENSKTLLECFMKLKSEQFLYRPLYDLSILKFLNFLPFSIKLVLEPESVKDAFITENPWNQIIAQPDGKPWIVGINSGEIGDTIEHFYHAHLLLINLINYFYKLLFPSLLGYVHTSSVWNWNTIGAAIKQFYFQEKPFRIAFQEFTQLFTDRAFIMPAINSTILHPGITYLYEYDHINEFRTKSNSKKLKTDYGAAHGDELISLFYRKKRLPLGVHGTDREVSDQLIEYWTNFATYGVPNAPNSSLIKWRPVANSEMNYLHIKNGKPKMKLHFRNKAFKFWSNLSISCDF